MSENKKSKAEVKELQEQLIKVQEQVEHNLAGWQRAQADYSNLKKEMEKKTEQLMEFANAAFMAEILPVYNHFKLAVRHIPEEQKDKDWVVGIMHIQKQFQDFLQKYNITEIKTVGEKFDHNLHEAVAHEEKADFESDVIFEEVQPGYMLGDKVVNHAKVKVAK